MNLRTRLAKLESSLEADTCPVCGIQLPAVTETRARMELFVARYQQEKGVTRAAAIVRVCDHAPLLMRRAGFLQIIPAGHCTGCGKDLRPAEEIAQSLLAQRKHWAMITTQHWQRCENARPRLLLICRRKEALL